jgi:hypothetical protein
MILILNNFFSLFVATCLLTCSADKLLHGVHVVFVLMGHFCPDEVDVDLLQEESGQDRHLE